MDDLQAISGIASSLTLNGFLLFIWYKEREERKEIQSQYRADLREIAGVHQPLRRNENSDV
jgi:hypothetical protein